MQIMTRAKAKAIAAEIEAYGGVLYGEKVAIMRDEALEKTEGGIIIPDTAKRKPLRGRCIMVGLGIRADQAAEGDKSKWAGLEVGQYLTFTKYESTHISVPLPGDKEYGLEIMHGFDVYIGFRDIMSEV
jgi:chaperonin GroES